jgi:hypothetical protein
MPVKTIPAADQKRAAQMFNFFSAIAVVTVLPIAIWIAASIFVYASVAHHPNPRVVDYLRPAGHRFYGLVGALVVVLNFSSQLAKLAGGAWNLALGIWVISLLVVVVPAIRDILRAGRDNWQDMAVEVEHA